MFRNTLNPSVMNEGSTTRELEEILQSLDEAEDEQEETEQPQQATWSGQQSWNSQPSPPPYVPPAPTPLPGAPSWMPPASGPTGWTPGASAMGGALTERFNFNLTEQKRRMIQEIALMQDSLAKMNANPVKVPAFDDYCSIDMVKDAYDLVKAVYDKIQGAQNARTLIDLMTNVAGFVFNGKREILGKTIDLSDWNHRVEMRSSHLNTQLGRCEGIGKLSGISGLSVLLTLGVSAVEAVRAGNQKMDAGASFGEDPSYHDVLADIDNNLERNRSSGR